MGTTGVDGATVEQRRLAQEAGLSAAVAITKSGADLEFAKDTRRAAGVTAQGGADLEYLGQVRANVICTGEATYAAAGGKVTRIVGQGFTGATALQAGGTAFTAFSVVSDEIIQATTPAKGAATYDLTVVHPDGNAVAVGAIVYV